MTFVKQFVSMSTLRRFTVKSSSPLTFSSGFGLVLSVSVDHRLCNLPPQHISLSVTLISTFIIINNSQLFTSWMVTTFTLQTKFGEDRYTQFQVVMVTDPPTHTPTNRQDRLQYTALQLAHSVISQRLRKFQWNRPQPFLLSYWHTESSGSLNSTIPDHTDIQSWVGR